MPGPFLTPQECAERLRVSIRTVYAWIASGALASIKLNRCRRIRPEDLEAFVQARREGGAA